MTVLAGIKLRQILHKPLVYNIHLPQPPGPGLLLDNLGLVAADLVIVNSQAVRQELADRDLPFHRIEVVSNGVDAQVYRPAPDWPADDGYVLFVGRLVPQKGVELLLRAFGVILYRCPQSRLVIVGDGEQELYLKRVARYLGFPHRVTFANWQTGPALVHLYQRAQVVAMPSYYEPFGIVALEAMSCGRPVVATRVGGLAEVIEDGLQGYLVPVGDHLTLARRLVYLILNSERRRQMGQAARVRAAEFSWSNVGSRTLTLYESVVGQPIEPNPTGVLFNLKQSLLAGLEQPLASMVAGLLDSVQ
jgi:1,4-alpha-glucan branching enzyme